MSDETERFIKTVGKHPYLFDRSHEYYKNVVMKAKAWNEIAGELHMTSKEAKTKWKNLRDSYMRYKKSTRGGTGRSKKYAKWPWSSHFSFLDGTLQIRSVDENKTRETEDAEIDRTINYESRFRPSTPDMIPPLSKKRKSQVEVGGCYSSETEVDKVIKLSDSKKSEEHIMDGVDHLFQSYAVTFKTFRPRTQAMMKLKLATLFSETELYELREQEESDS